MMSRYFLDGFGSEDELNKLRASNAFPLVREMQHKFGLKVLHETDNARADRTGYMMCHPNGVAVGLVWATKTGGENHDQLEYCFRTPYYRKARGQDVNDKETVRSIKLSSLMATLKRQGAVKDMKELTDSKLRQARSGVSLLQSAMGTSTKQNPFTANEIHALLAALLGESTDGIPVTLDLNKCKNILDNYKEADRIRDVKVEESKRFFKNPFYLVGVDAFKHLLIGKFKMNKIGESSNECEYETIEDFKRYRTVEDYPELVPLMTMMKVSYENKSESKLGPMNFPVMDRYDEGLDAVFYYNSQPSRFDHAWMITPCPI
jgi:hypothetical protein